MPDIQVTPELIAKLSADLARAAELARRKGTENENFRRRGAMMALAAIVHFLVHSRFELSVLSVLVDLTSALVDAEAGRKNAMLAPNSHSGGPKMQMMKAMKMATAAAAVTLLTEKNLVSLEEALKRSAARFGTSPKQLQSFRKNLTATDGRGSETALFFYSSCLRAFSEVDFDSVPPDADPVGMALKLLKVDPTAVAEQARRLLGKV
ncbi:MAG: hypothetical protein AB7V13_13510 [Pseudorhodoplanes sp.]